MPMPGLLQKIHFWLFANQALESEHHLRLKHYLVNALLLVTSLIILAFSALHTFYFDNPFLAKVDLVAGLVTLFAYIDFRINRHITRSSYIGSAILFIFFLSLANSLQNNDFTLIWTIFFPIFVMTLLGHKRGLILSLIFYIALFIIAYQGIGTWQEGDWSFKSFIRLVVASLVLTYILYVREAALYLAMQKAQEALKDLHTLSITDPLTGLYNRRYINEQLNQKIQDSQQNKSPLSIAMIDIDNFKQINDHHGHNFGDLVLKEMAELIKTQLSNQQTLGRWGGEEFIIIFDQYSSKQAAELCEELRQRAFNITVQHPLNISLSFGIAQYRKGSEYNTFIARADDALYQAKNSGKNCIIQSEF